MNSLGRYQKRAALTCLLFLLLSIPLLAQGRNPVIFIPGLSGSELRDRATGEKVWFRTIKAKSEDLRLPIGLDPSKLKDNLVATDVLRTVKVGSLPIVDIYGEFLKALTTRGGYHEESWDDPSTDGYHDAVYVFPYDWRLDNVVTSQMLVRKVEELRKKLKRPDLKFDIVAHSMGGLISRYAAMYGDADLPANGSKPVPKWAGAKLFEKIVMLGTPNEGSVLALSTLINGFTVGGVRIDLPFVEDTSKFSTFTIPSAYQLLPAPGTFKAYDDRLEPVEIDLYDPKTWSKYGWNAIEDKDFADQFSSAENKVAREYFGNALERARRFHEALAAAPNTDGGIGFYLVGADCRTALDAAVVYFDKNSSKWRTLLRPKGFTRWDGYKITDDDLKKLMIGPGDGVVSERSLEAGAGRSMPKLRAENKFCEEHNRLAANTKIQDHVISILTKRASAADRNETKK